MLSATIGECSATLVRNPFELIKQNLQIGRFGNVTDTFKHIFKTHGIIVRIIK